MKIRTATFHCSAADPDACPTHALAEFAFIGRSNVGKSSLINMLTGQKDLAKVSGKPGKTILINFFTINQRWSLVDLPGYGYAKTGKKERKHFSSMITGYLEGRANLTGIFVLIDSMLPPQPIDLDFLQWMIERELPFMLVFTKADRHSKSSASQNIAAFLEQLRELSPDEPAAILSSSKLGLGRGEILDCIAAALETQAA